MFVLFLFPFLLFFKFIFNWRIILYNIMLAPAIKQCESAISIHMSAPCGVSLPPPTLSPSSKLSQSPRLNTLCHSASSHKLSILYVVMYMSQCYSFNLSHPLLSPMCPQVFSIYISIATLQIGSSVPVFWISYICVNNKKNKIKICFSLSDLLHSI